MDIIERLNSLRLERGLTVYRLSELSGINQSTLANTFSRRTVPSIGNLSLMCEAMGVTLSQFFASDQSETYVSEEESMLLEKYRRLPCDMKKSLAEFLSALSAHIEM